MVRWVRTWLDDFREVRNPSNNMIRFIVISAVFCSSLSANVCTVATIAATGIDNIFPAVVNGVDGLGWSTARIQWTADGSPSFATAQQIQYATAAEWAASPGTYPHITAQTTQPVTFANQIQSGIVSNLLPSTTYHFLAQSLQGGTLCTATDQTFTTTAKPAGIIQPQLPITVDTTRPLITGIDWFMTNGSITVPAGYMACPSQTAGTTYSIVSTNLQNCLSAMSPGDGLGIAGVNQGGLAAYPISQAYLQQPTAVNVTCSTGTGLCTLASEAAPANGTQVVMGSQVFGTVPSPINPGVPYYVVSSNNPTTPGTFALSLTSGGSAITLLSAGSTPAYLVYPVTQARMVIHSVAASNLLPPVGVRLGPDALAQYLPNMPNLQAIDPLLGANGQSYLQYSPLTANVTWENIAFSVDPSVATVSGTNATDPANWIAPVQLNITNQGIIFDTCAFLHPGTPTRIAQMNFDGVNSAMVNSYVALDYWEPHYYVPSNTYMTVSGNTITIPAANISRPDSAGPKVTCAIPSGTITISGGGSGSLYLWTNSDCTQGGSLTTGLSASTTISGLTITNSASPGYPTWTYTSPTGLTQLEYAGIPLSYVFTIVSGTITDTNSTITNNWTDIGNNNKLTGGGRFEGSTGIEIAAWGPFKFDNNYIQGSAIGGIFWADDLTLASTPCQGVACSVASVLGNLTVTRNTFTTDPIHFFYDSASWDGGNRYWRNLGEQKVGRYSLYDGNIYGPWSQQVGKGECGLHEEFENQMIPVVNTAGGYYPSYVNSSDWTFTNNTLNQCGSAGITTAYSFQGFIYFGYPIKNFLIQNDLFINNNAYAQISQNNQPFASTKVPDPSNGGCPNGWFTYLEPAEAIQYDHITISGQGGCQPFLIYQNLDYISGGMTNSVLNIVTDSVGVFSSATQPATYFQPSGWLGGSCSSGGATSVIFGCMNDWNFSGNMLLYSWTSSIPGSTVDYTTSGISTNQGSYWSGITTLRPTGNTLATRQTFSQWFNVSAANFRYAAGSPYISGSHPGTTDGLDVGVNMDQLEQHQGKVSNVRVLAKTSTSFTLGFYAPDSFACGVDWSTNAFSTWTRVVGATGSPDPRVQSVAVTGVTAHAAPAYRLNCAVQQPTGTIQLP